MGLVTGWFRGRSDQVTLRVPAKGPNLSFRERSRCEARRAGRSPARAAPSKSPQQQTAADPDIIISEPNHPPRMSVQPRGSLRILRRAFMPPTVRLNRRALKRGYDLPTAQRYPGPFPIVSSSGISGRDGRKMATEPGVVTGRYGTIGEVFFIDGDFWPLNTPLYVCDFKGNDPRFVCYNKFQIYTHRISSIRLQRPACTTVAGVRLQSRVRCSRGLLTWYDPKLHKWWHRTWFNDQSLG